MRTEIAYDPKRFNEITNTYVEEEEEEKKNDPWTDVDPSKRLWRLNDPNHSGIGFQSEHDSDSEYDSDSDSEYEIVVPKKKVGRPITIHVSKDVYIKNYYNEHKECTCVCECGQEIKSRSIYNHKKTHKHRLQLDLKNLRENL
jgi:hypothetical protein